MLCFAVEPGKKKRVTEKQTNTHVALIITTRFPNII